MENRQARSSVSFLTRGGIAGVPVPVHGAGSYRAVRYEFTSPSALSQCALQISAPYTSPAPPDHVVVVFWASQFGIRTEMLVVVA
jgi:hypothetical protein